MDAGVVCEEDKLRYIMYSHEAGKHNMPHVHVRNTSYEYEAVILLQDGQVLADGLPSKLKKAQRKVLDDQEYSI